MANPKFLYPYTVRRSPRARHVRFVVSADGLVVVVPQRFAVSRDLLPLLESKREWIEKALHKIASRTLLRDAAKGVPGSIEFPSIGESWQVRSATLEKERFRAENGIVFLTSDYSETEAVIALKRWVLQKGRIHLPPLLRKAAQYHAFQVANVAVKEQKSLWGSCSSKSNINLNCRLLFLSPELMRHVMLHELCHLIEMNHSPAFYALLRKLDPETESNARKLRRAWDLVPVWAL